MYHPHLDEHCPNRTRRFTPARDVARRALQTTALCAALASCSAQADIQEIVLTQEELVFEGLPAIAAGFGHELTRTFEHPGNLELPSFVTPRLYPVQITIAANDGTADLSFIENLKLSVGTTSVGGLPARLVASYERADDALRSSLSTVIVDGGDLVDYWTSGEAYYNLTVGGELPTTDWAIAITMKFRGELDMSF